MHELTGTKILSSGGPESPQTLEVVSADVEIERARKAGKICLRAPVLRATSSSNSADLLHKHSFVSIEEC